MLDDGDAELQALRAVAYGRAAGEPERAAAVARLAELEPASNHESSAQDVLAAEESDGEVRTSPRPAQPDAIELARRPQSSRSILVIGLAGIGVLAVGVLIGLAVGRTFVESSPRAAPSLYSEISADDVPPEAADSLERVAAWVRWDATTLQFGTFAGGAAVWVGMLNDLEEVCIAIDDRNVATVLCNPAGQYPSEFVWQKPTDPGPGVYTFTVEQTGEVQVATAPGQQP